MSHLADLTGVTSYTVRIEFTQRFEPSSLSTDGLPFVSVADEIDANSSSERGESLRAENGRIPYGSPLYLWEAETAGASLRRCTLGRRCSSLFRGGLRDTLRSSSFSLTTSIEMTPRYISGSVAVLI